MSLTKEVTADKIEVVTGQDEDGNDVTSVQVRTATKVLEDGAVISQSYHRHVIQSGDDWHLNHQTCRTSATQYLAKEKTNGYMDYRNT